jgi:predicted nucleic acid-binding protein
VSAYADTSFLVSLYIQDVNSVPAARLMTEASLPVLMTSLGELELVNALQLRRFRREIELREAKAAATLYRRDRESGIFVVKSLSAAVFQTAEQLSRRRTALLGTRTLDILHVASALVLKSEFLYTFDNSQRMLAKAEGLQIP